MRFNVITDCFSRKFFEDPHAGCSLIGHFCSENEQILLPTLLAFFIYVVLPYWVYIIQSKSTGRYYCGDSDDVDRRVSKAQ